VETRDDFLAARCRAIDPALFVLGGIGVDDPLGGIRQHRIQSEYPGPFSDRPLLDSRAGLLVLPVETALAVEPDVRLSAMGD